MRKIPHNNKASNHQTNRNLIVAKVQLKLKRKIHKTIETINIFPVSNAIPQEALTESLDI
jgi:hypothetical protein